MRPDRDSRIYLTFNMRCPAAPSYDVSFVLPQALSGVTCSPSIAGRGHRHDAHRRAAVVDCHARR